MNMDEESPNLSDSTVVTARKRWVCGECRQEICVGQKYAQIKQLFDGEWSTIRLCVECNAASLYLSAHGEGHRWRELLTEYEFLFEDGLLDADGMNHFEALESRCKSNGDF